MGTTTRNRTHPPLRLGCQALIRNDRGAILLLRPDYKPGWLLPGGAARAGEPPHAACARWVGEKTGLVIAPGSEDLLLADAVDPNPDADPTAGLNLVFDGGTADPAEVRLSTGHGLLDHRWVESADEAELTAFGLEPYQARRVARAAHARSRGTALYLHQGHLVPQPA